MKIVESGGYYTIYRQVNVLDLFDPGNYTLEWDAKLNCALAKAPDFSFPEQYYDVGKEFRSQVKKSFRSTDKNIGVLLQGYKGQGKTVEAKKLCQEMGIMTVMITKQVPKAVDFPSYLNSIEQPLIVFIDEFEKIFSQSSRNPEDNDKNFHSQDSFLTIMDGALNSNYQRLFILTSNDEIGDKFLNRPSRIRYRKYYNFMPKELYDNIIETKLQHKELEKDLRENLPVGDCTVDLITTIIEEINLHKKPYSSFKDFFNHSPRRLSYERYIYKKGEFEFKDYVESTEELSSSTNYFFGVPGTMIKVEGSYLFYKSRERDLKGNLVEVIYRVKKSNFHNSTVISGERITL